MKLNARAELAELGRFLAAPRRTPLARAPGAPWAARALFFAVAVQALNIVIEFGVLAPLAVRAGIGSKMPESVTPGWVLVALGFAPMAEELVFRAGLRRAGYVLFIGPALIALLALPWRQATLIVIAAKMAL